MTLGLEPFIVFYLLIDLFIYLFVVLGCIQWVPNIALFTQGSSRMRHCYDPEWHVSNNIYRDSIMPFAQREKKLPFLVLFCFFHRLLEV